MFHFRTTIFETQVYVDHCFYNFYFIAFHLYTSFYALMCLPRSITHHETNENCINVQFLIVFTMHMIASMCVKRKKSTLINLFQILYVVYYTKSTNRKKMGGAYKWREADYLKFLFNENLSCL